MFRNQNQNYATSHLYKIGASISDCSVISDIEIYEAGVSNMKTLNRLILLFNQSSDKC